MSKTRLTLAKRLADIVSLPASEIAPQERHMAGDVLYDLIREADPALRRRIARRIAPLGDPPTQLLKLLAKDNIEIAEILLTESAALGDSDLVDVAQAATSQHRRLIAQRLSVGELVCEALIKDDEPDVIEALLANTGARLSNRAVDVLVAASRDHASYPRQLIGRPELRPVQALTMFWWCGAEERERILERFAVTRNLMQESVTGVFAMAEQEGWQDAASRKTLQFIEPRQRNRKAIDKSPYDSLEQAVETAEREGFSRELVEEISYLSGVKPAMGAQIFTDLGGEGIAILCKATGLKRDALSQIWRAMRRDPAMSDDGGVFARVVKTYDTLSVDKAQTVLRYWNWALTSFASPAISGAMSVDDAPDIAAPARAAALVFSGR